MTTVISRPGSMPDVASSAGSSSCADALDPTASGGTIASSILDSSVTFDWPLIMATTWRSTLERRCPVAHAF